MIVRNNIFIKLSIALMVLVLFASSCRFDNLLETSSSSENGIALYIPGAETVVVRSAASSSERYIRNAAVLFTQSNGTTSMDDDIVLRSEYVTNIEDNGTANPKITLVNIVLSELDGYMTSGTVTLHVVCNFDTSISASAINNLATNGATLADAKDLISGTAAYETTGTGNEGELDTPLLMYGTATWGGSTEMLGTISMRFQVAKISVTVEDDAIAEGLSVQSFFSYASAPNTTWGESNDDNRQESSYRHRISADNTSDWIYLYETKQGTTYSYEGVTLNAFNSIVLAVKNPNTEVDENRSGLEIANDGEYYVCLTYDEMNTTGTGAGTLSTANTFQRGYHYTFNIKSVFPRGYATVAEALANPSNVGYTVTVSSDWDTYLYNGQYVLETTGEDLYVLFNNSGQTNLLTTIGLEGIYNSLTATVSLVRAVSNNGGGYETQTVSTDQVQLYHGTGGSTSAGDENSFTVSASALSSGYPVYYSAATSVNDLPEGMYLQIQCGDMELFKRVGSAEITVDFDSSTTFGTDKENRDISVEAQVKWPGSSTAEDLPFTWSYVDSNGDVTTADWLDVSLSDISGAEVEGTVTVYAQTDNSPQFEDTVDNFDLSTNGGDWSSRSTANSYVVNAPGNYKLPLVYGNAIKDGSPNSSAYTTDGAPMTMVRQFVGHDGNVIEDPYIDTHLQKYGNPSLSTGNYEAVCLWNDINENLITDVKIAQDSENGNEWYLYFTVNESYLDVEGNAVLGLRETGSNEFIWSWHIWMTSYDPYDESVSDDETAGTKTITSWQGKTYYAMYRYLGACTSIDAPARYVNISFHPSGAQAQNGTSVLVYQESLMDVGDVCYYQSGRKDPIPGITGGYTNTANKTTYGSHAWVTQSTGSTVYVSDNCAEMLTLQEQIKYPYKTNDLFEERYTDESLTINGYNLWNSTRTDNSIDRIPFDTYKVTKTIYDPCPPGFSMPPSDLFSALFPYEIYEMITEATTYYKINYTGEYDENTVSYPIILRDQSSDVYSLMVVPYRGSSGSLATAVLMTIYTATPNEGVSAQGGNVRIYGPFAVQLNSSNELVARFTYSSSLHAPCARAVLPIREME